MMSPAERTISLQLWTIRQSLADSPERALERVCEMGYRFVELAPLPDGLSLSHLCDVLKSFGLRVASMHAELPTAGSQNAVAEQMRIADCRRLIWSGWPRDARSESLQGWRRMVVDYQDAAQWAAREGVTLGLHNHWWEFEPLDGVQPFWFVQQELPESVFLQLDVYWAQVAGQDPVALLQQAGSRIQSIHLKDGPAIHGLAMSPLGQGRVAIQQVLAHCGTSVDWVVELDDYDGDPLDAAAQSLAYLLPPDSTSSRDR